MAEVRFFRPNESTVPDTDDIVARLSEFFAVPKPSLDGLAAAYLFGSVARREARLGSDVDVAVLWTQDPPQTLEGYHFDLQYDLIDLLGREVQLLNLNRAPVDLVHRVLRDGILLAQPDASARVSFIVRSRAAYFDLQPVLNRYRGAPHGSEA